MLPLRTARISALRPSSTTATSPTPLLAHSVVSAACMRCVASTMSGLLPAVFWQKLRSAVSGSAYLTESWSARLARVAMVASKLSKIARPLVETTTRSSGAVGLFWAAAGRTQASATAKANTAHRTIATSPTPKSSVHDRSRQHASAMVLTGGTLIVSRSRRDDTMRPGNRSQTHPAQSAAPLTTQ